jgi:hypothetical protein
MNENENFNSVVGGADITNQQNNLQGGLNMNGGFGFLGRPKIQNLRK